MPLALLPGRLLLLLLGPGAGPGPGLGPAALLLAAPAFLDLPRCGLAPGGAAQAAAGTTRVGTRPASGQ
jgi:hypothetical protein